MNDPSLNKAIAMLLQTFPGSAVAIYLDGLQYRAAIVRQPTPHECTGAASECRQDPNTAVLRLRTNFIESAHKRLADAEEYMANLTHSPFSAYCKPETATPPCPHYYAEALKRSCIDCNSVRDDF